MSVAVCRGPVVVPAAFEAPCWLKPATEPYKPEPVVERRLPARADIWNAIQADVDRAATGAKKAPTNSVPYAHPLVRRSSSSRLMSQKSLEVCTESLGNETGSGDFTDMACLFSDSSSPLPAVEEPFFWEQHGAARDREEEDDEEECCENDKGLAAVNYHRSSPPRRSFPPPLPSMSRRDGPCLRMRTRREDGRLVVEAVAVRPRGYLHARRQDGRLRLSFVECCSAREQSSEQSRIAAAAVEEPYFPAVEPEDEQEEEDAATEMEDEDEEEEEVEVVDRGTVVEVKVSTQPQTPAAAGKALHRCSRLVINKFVGSTPLTLDHQQPRCQNDAEAAAVDEAPPSPPKLRRVPSSTTTLAAAVAAASTTGTGDEPAPEDDDEECAASLAAAAEPKQLLLFTSRRGDKQDLLQSVRRCRQLRQKPLFILEPYCIATT